MASIVLQAAGSAIGGAVLGPGGGLFASQLGKVAGTLIDRAVFGGVKLKDREGPRLSELSVQTSTYGKMIPLVYGTARLAGNVIWSRPIQETATTTTSSAGGGKGGGGKISQTSTTYSYSVTLAIAICEGPIDTILRAWADSKQLDLSLGTYRLYLGDEEQLPDSVIESVQGVGMTPAYRGLAYVIIEDFPLADYGNRIPNFTFEVKKKALANDYNGQALEEMIEGMIMIPGSGEFVYDTQVEYKVPGQEVGGNWVQQGPKQPINRHSAESRANALVSLDQLAETCPNIEWIAVVVTWFGDSLDAGDCVIKPGVEFQTGAITEPDFWQVGSFTRTTARQITLVEGYPRYGGTPDDQSLVRYLTELRARGYNIMFYPMFFMDVDDKPWRGRVTGSASDVADFFTKTHGYNDFITHYADLVDGKVDAFVIGSELIGLTSVASSPGDFPAVTELVSLAGTVKSILGGEVTVTYAADWSEYHHTTDGWYNLDPLWASPDIDVVGIDAYFPLTDSPQDGYAVQPVMDGWTSGEGYDWIYTDPGRTVQAALDPEYAWKNIAWWWENTHTNPDSSVTDWVPESKKIWFTEFGFPSVDGATNQPNVFYDPDSQESFFPRHSKGRVDFRAQRQGLVATHAKWQGSEMIERMFVWTWDARPYPFWPDLLSVWTDGTLWQTGHWVTGKLGISNLAAIVADLCRRSGLEESQFDVSDLTDLVQGYIITQQQTPRESIEELASAYFFDATETGGQLKFVKRGQEAALTIAEDSLIDRTSGDARRLLSITRAQEMELPQKVQVLFLAQFRNYQIGTQFIERSVPESRGVVTLNLPIVMPGRDAKRIADMTLFNAWMGRTSFVFEAPTRYAALEPADVIEVTAGGITHTLRITRVRISGASTLLIEGVAEDTAVYDFYTPPGEEEPVVQPTETPVPTALEILDLPAFPSESGDSGALRFAACGLAEGWRGAALYRSDDGGNHYGYVTGINAPAVIGTAIDALAEGAHTVFDEASSVTVLLLSLDAELESVSTLAVLNGANAALIGEEIVQFRTATLIEPGKYELSGLLRGRMGTESAISAHEAGERFVLLNGNLMREPMPNSVIGLARMYKAVPIGESLEEVEAESFTYQARALKPFSPVHVAGVRDGSGNLAISWVRRARVGGELRDYVDVPLHETAEAYEVEILDGGDVVRTIAGLNSPAASYSASDQTVDFGSPQSSVSIRIYQLSGIIGRGTAATAAV